MNISRDRFINSIEGVKAQMEYDSQQAHKLGEAFPSAFTANLLYDNSVLKNGYLSLLRSLTNDVDEWIDWFIYENDFGQDKKLCHNPDGTGFYLNDAGELYDFLEQGYER